MLFSFKFIVSVYPIELVHIEMTLNPNNRSSKDRDAIIPNNRSSKNRDDIKP